MILWRGVFPALVFLLLLSASSAGAQSPAGDVFSVQARIFAGDDLLGQPRIQAMSASEVAMTVDGPRGYSLRLTVEDDAERAGVSDPIKLNARLYFTDGSRWVLVGTPSIRMSAGGTARMSSTDPTIYGPDGYGVEFTVTRADRAVSAADPAEARPST